MTPKQKAVAALITRIVSDWTGGTGDARPLISIAMRESGLNPSALGDSGANGPAAKAWKREKPKFVKAGNPWADQDQLWHYSIGLFQAMPANHLPKWDVLADPRVLADVVTATIVAGRQWNRARDLGAKTPVDVRMIWAFGPDGIDIPKNSTRYLDRLRSERKRMADLGFPAALAEAPISSFFLDDFGVGPQHNQEERAAAIRQGVELPDPPTQKTGIGGLVLFLLAIWGLS